MVDDHVGAICDLLDSTGLAEKTTVIYASDHGEALGLRGHWGKSNLYNECTQVPLVMAGPGVPTERTCSTPVNLFRNRTVRCELSTNSHEPLQHKWRRSSGRR
jgi:choline-sulfatase